MAKPVKNIEADFLGDLEPLRNRRAKAEMDRRRVSFSWLGGSVLTGFASVLLMGGALYAALDGRQHLAIPAQAYQSDELTPDEIQIASKGDRPVNIRSSAQSQPEKVIMVSTISRVGDQDVVKLKPFMHVSTPLAAIPRRDFDYPGFDPLAIFSESGKAEPLATSADLIYGAEVENEISLKIEDFPFGDPRISLVRRQSTEDIEAVVREAAPALNVGATALTAISYFDTARFSSEDNELLSNPALTVTAENVSQISRTHEEEYSGLIYEERFAKVADKLPTAFVLQGQGLSESEAVAFSNAMSQDLAAEDLLKDDRLRMMFEVDTSSELPVEKIARISVYRGGQHLVSVVRKENGSLVLGRAPDPVPEQPAGPNAVPLLAKSNMPNLYDAIYRAALNEDLTPETAGKLIRIFAFDVDFRSPVSRDDEIELFMSLPDGASEPTTDSEILYAGLQQGGVMRQYYRFRDPESGTVDYYDETGRSAKQFLLRQPVPNGKFRSPYGMRRHPITRVRKMHTGVDWSAPRGTPILAAGNGIVEKAGWAGGYGKQTILRHANGYKTSYNHQTAFAKGVKEGARVRQGQVIGYVGSTGLSTGPHLHYEMFVNNNRVDPMRIKFPSGKVFKGDELKAFEAERDRIDSLLEERRLANQRFASN